MEGPTSPTSPASPTQTPISPDAYLPDFLPSQDLPQLITTFPPPPAIRRPSIFQSSSTTPTTPSSRHFSSPSPIDLLFTPSPTQASGRQSCLALHGPILDRVVSLPLRVNTSAVTTLQVPTTKTKWSPSHTRSPAISRRARSPIRKPRCTLRATRSPPPKYHVTVVPSDNPVSSLAYAHSISHLRTPLAALVSVSTGLPHPEFPQSLLQYHLLTHAQLDSLARWYHQVTPPQEETWQYTAWIPAWTSAGGEDGRQVELATKRRRWGRFIGLKGCESPVTAGAEGEKEGENGEGEERLVERMEREWRNALRRAEEEEILRGKGWRGRW